jgi:hypothetical protein
MYKHLGMRVFVLTANKDLQGAVAVAEYAGFDIILRWWRLSRIRHDYNDELGDGQSFAESHPNWDKDNILEQWMEYARASLGMCFIVCSRVV